MRLHTLRRYFTFHTRQNFIAHRNSTGGFNGVACLTIALQLHHCLAWSVGLIIVRQMIYCV